VGRVHLGVVHIFKLDEPNVEKREAMITNLEFLSREELLKRRETLETWSQLCVDQLDRLFGIIVCHPASALEMTGSLIPAAVRR